MDPLIKRPFASRIAAYQIVRLPSTRVIPNLSSDLLGSYAAAEAEAGAVKSAEAQALTKGEVSLALAGTGSGWSLGVSGAKFTITRKKK